MQNYPKQVIYLGYSSLQQVHPLQHLLKMTCEEETPSPARLTLYRQSAGDGLGIF